MFYTIDNVRGFSGYSKAVRELAFAMSKKTSVKCVDFVQRGYLPDRIYTLLLGGMPKLRKQDVVFGRVYFDNPFRFNGEHHIIANFVLESTRFPESAVRDMNLDRIAQIWVPSKHVRDNLLANNVISEKIHIVPHGYTPIYTMQHRDSKPYFKFLFNGGYTGEGDRKGADLLVRAYREEFKDEIKDAKVLLHLKINTSYGDASKELEGRGTVVDTDFYTEEEMVQIFNTADCYVCPSAGEGFDMGTLEAMACGLPIIHNSWGGQVDYLNGDRVWKLESNFVPAKFSPWDNGNWKRPYLVDLKAALRSMYIERYEIKKYPNIEEWTWDKGAEKAIKCIDLLVQ